MKIYLHWTGTPYDWCLPDEYHTVATWDPRTKKAKLHHLTPYNVELHAHTYGRNRNSIALAISCMDPQQAKWSCPPRPEQIDLITTEVAHIILDNKLDQNPNALQRYCLTHAEAAALRDYPLELVRKYSEKSPSSIWDHLAQQEDLPHANYGPRSWPDGWPGGDVVRWDLYQLTAKSNPGSGGHELRYSILKKLYGLKGK